MTRRLIESWLLGLREPIRVTTDPDFYEENPESVEFWTPGNPLFPKPTGDLDAGVTATTGRLSDLLTQRDWD
jgi:hypothetical protein